MMLEENHLLPWPIHAQVQIWPCGNEAQRALITPGVHMSLFHRISGV